jgi:hypothetical protein
VQHLPTPTRRAVLAAATSVLLIGATPPARAQHGRSTLQPVARLKLFADYFQIYIEVEPTDEVALWADDDTNKRFSARSRLIAFGTGRNMIVPVDVYQHAGEPDLTSRIDASDHAIRAGLRNTSGQFKIAGCTDYRPDAFALKTGTGLFGIAFFSFGLATIKDLDGDDRYELHVWPVSVLPKPEVLRQAPKLTL